MTTTTSEEPRIDVQHARAGYWWNAAAVVALVLAFALAAAGAGRTLILAVAGGAVFCGLVGHRSRGFAAGFRQGSASAALNLARRITERAPAASKVSPNLPGLVALREANAEIEGWSWCEEHKYPRYNGPNPCDRLHQNAPGARICGYHLRAHGPGEFGALCTAWADVQTSIERQRWWNHLRR